MTPEISNQSPLIVISKENGKKKTKSIQICLEG